MDYPSFLENKRIVYQHTGKTIASADVHPLLFDFQRDIVKWAVGKGRAAIFADTGLGKTLMQVEWARLVGENTLIVAPLSVARQTVREAMKIDVTVRYVRSMDAVTGHGIWITNYEMLDKFDPAAFGAVVLDESSILKSLDGKTRRKLIDMFQATPYRLACTATPAPNDNSELGNHSEFLGVASMTDMLAMFYVHANKVSEQIVNGHVLRTKFSNSKGQEWRIKHHARQSFYRWMSSWAMSIRFPSDLGYDDDGFILPPLNIKPVWVQSDYVPDNQLVFTGLSGIEGRLNVRKMTLDDRVDAAASLVNGNDEQWIVWCGLNSESALITSLIPGSVEIVGSDDPETKVARIEAFQDGEYRVLVTKPSIAGFGMNFQNAHNMVFVGLNDSWETYYQAIRRQYRFGQQYPVNVYIVLSELEHEIYDNILRKEGMATEMSQQLIEAVKSYETEELTGTTQATFQYDEMDAEGTSWKIMLGDSCQRLGELDENSIDLSVYSPPFADLYTYSASELDLGNSRGWDEFFRHYAYIIRGLLRVTKPGRLTCVHTSDIPAMAVKDGYIGIKDFPGAVVRAYEENGWTFFGRAVVAKNPQAQAIRTKSKGLLFVQLRKDSSDSRPALLDHILIFKKPGDNTVPVLPVENGELDNETWIDWAGGIWTGISESDTLQYQHARAQDDEKHICPLQLGTIERCIKLYSNPGETVLTPFMGIGSEVFQAVRFGRVGIGIELKPEYFQVALQHLLRLDREQTQPTLFDLLEIPA